MNETTSLPLRGLQVELKPEGNAASIQHQIFYRGERDLNEPDLMANAPDSYVKPGARLSAQPLPESLMAVVHIADGLAQQGDPSARAAIDNLMRDLGLAQPPRSALEVFQERDARDESVLLASGSLQRHLRGEFSSAPMEDPISLVGARAVFHHGDPLLLRLPAASAMRERMDEDYEPVKVVPWERQKMQETTPGHAFWMYEIHHEMTLDQLLTPSPASAAPERKLSQ